MSYKIFDQNVFIAAQDSPSIDAFDRLRISNPVTIFDSQLEYDAQPFLWDTKILGTSNTEFIQTESAEQLNVGTSNGDAVIVQSKEYARYQPGKSQMIIMTGVVGEGANNCQKLFGYGDDKNGIFLGQDGGGVFMLLRSNSSGTVSDERKVYQTSWNIDPMNGLGKSGYVFDPTKTQIFFMDIEWLGVGRIRTGFVIDGIIYYVHQFLNANVIDKTYMTTANLPVRYEIRNTGDTQTPNSLKRICASVISEGGVQQSTAYPFADGVLGVDIPLGEENAEIIFAARPGITFNGFENRGKFEPTGYEIIATGGTVISKVLYNPLITGGTWVNPYNESFVETNTTIGTGFSGGTTIDMTLVSGGNKGNVGQVGRDFASRLPFGIGIDGDDPVSIALAVYATSSNVVGDFAFKWQEIR